METKTLPPAARSPVRERRYTVEEYFEMGRLGIIGPEERVELLAGRIVEQMSEGPLHAFLTRTIRALCEWLIRDGGLEPVVVVENHPLVIAEHDVPQPDIFLIREEVGPHRHPGPADTLLVVEVAVTTLAYDREEKLPRYALGGIPEVWIVNTDEQVLEVYRDPQRGRYRQVLTLEQAEEVSVASVPDLGAIAVRDLFTQPK